VGVAIGAAFKLMARYADMRFARYDSDAFIVLGTHVRVFISERKTHVYGGQWIDIAKPADSSFGVYHALLIGKGNSVDVGRLAMEALDLARRLVLLCTPPCPERCGLCGAEHPASACPERGLDPRLAGLAALLPPEGDEGAPIG
jgi:hypothetical protein